jgi:lysozyme family protein
VSFEVALAFVLAEERGLSDHPADSGGLTLNGITQRRYAVYRRARELPAQSVSLATDHEIHSIYGEEWEAAKCSEWPAPVALVAFDTAVQRGPPRSIRDVQEAVRVTADGMVGPITRAAVAAMPVRQLVERLLIARSDHYVARARNEASQMAFLKGWMRRIVRLSIEAGTGL